MKAYYKGFSTRNYEETGQLFSVYNVQCVEEDLMNEIFTIRGERLMMPTYGTRIPLLVFEIGDKETMDIIREDLTTVVKNDPRVQLVSMSIVPLPDRNAMTAVMKINYLEFDVTQDLMITVTSR